MSRLLPSATLRSAVLVVLMFTGSLTSAAEDDGPTLTIGSAAPVLDIEHWVQDGDGKFKPVTEFGKGKVYIVEFWATWCGPCIASMPHISELQHTYADKGVQVVSVSDEPLETVEKFLAKNVRGETDRTYAELTKNYCLTTDPDESVYKDYMAAAGQNGIPTAFIVGKSGLVEWIGHPMTIDDALKAVVDDSWDRVAFAEELKQQEALKAMLAEFSRLMRAGDVEAGAKLLDEAIEASPAKGRNNLLMMKVQVLLSTEQAAAVGPVVSEMLKSASSPEAVNRITWQIYKFSERGADIDEKTLQICLRATAAAAKKSKGAEKGQILDTMAHLHHAMGNLDKAIAVQKRAVKFAEGETKSDISDYLETLKNEQKGGDEDSEKPAEGADDK
jgi:thiol-disulfide isomerase/thioredoxin